MQKAWTIGWKDTLIRLKDRTALLFLILTPLALTLLMGQVFTNDEGPALPAIPMTLVDQDDSDRSRELVALLRENPALAELLAVELRDDLPAARAEIEAGGHCCLLLLPPAFGGALNDGQPTTVELYTDPASTIGAEVVRAVVDRLLADLAGRATVVAVTMETLDESGRLSDPAVAQALPTRLAATAADPTVTLETLDRRGSEQQFDPIAVIGPGLALLFLSFSVAQGARAFLQEEQQGTLPRLAASPTSASTILLGKMIGIFVAGLLQFGALLLGVILLFQVSWGDPLGVVALALLLVLAFTALGLVLAVVAHNDAQANQYGTIGSLLIAMIGGTFVNRSQLPEWLQQLGLITPNAWGIDGFAKLALGGGLVELAPQLAALALMSLLFFSVGLAGYRRRVVR